MKSTVFGAATANLFMLITSAPEACSHSICSDPPLFKPEEVGECFSPPRCRLRLQGSASVPVRIVSGWHIMRFTVD
jgi:hypothetical protein